MAYDLSGILSGGAAGRADSISGLDPQFRAVIEQMMAAAPPDVAKQLRIMSAYRSPEVQAQLWSAALGRYGSASAARKWVAPPPGVAGGKGSQHNFGRAIDWQYLDKGAREWVRANAEKYGGYFPLAHEPWHMELRGTRGSEPLVASSSQPTGVTLNSNAMGLVAAPETAEPTSTGIEDVVSGLFGGGGQQQQQAQEAAQIQPSSVGLEVGGGASVSSAAAQIMATLMQDRRNRYGLSLTGMM